MRTFGFDRNSVFSLNGAGFFIAVHVMSLNVWLTTGAVIQPS